MPRILVERFVGRARDFHARDMPNDHDVHIWWFEPVSETLVLGSTQAESLVDQEACLANEVEVVQRRSGGGLVLLSRSGTLWLDVVLPVIHPLWDRDVTSSSFWVGEAWMKALDTCGAPALVQHRARLERNPVSDLICFAGKGPGEVFLVGDGLGSIGAKVVGISQRRTRLQARFQTAVSLQWQPTRLLGLLHDPKPDLDDILDAGSTLDLDGERLIEVMTKCLVDVLSRHGDVDETWTF